MTTCVLDDSRNPARRGVPTTTTDSLKVGREPSDHGDFLKRLEAAEERDVATSKLISGSASRASAARLQRSFKRRPVPVAEPTKLANSDPPPQLRLSEANLNARRVSDPSATGTTGAGIKTPSSTFRSFRSAGSGTLTVRKDGVHKLEVTVENHPSEDGVIVTALGSEGACAASGLKVGDHITKINGIRAQDHATAIWLVDACDDKVRFSLKEATQTFCVDRARSSKRQPCDGDEGEAGEGVNRGASGGASGGSSGGVGVVGADGGATELDVGLTLVNNISEGGVGVVVVEAKAGLAADRAGLKRGHVIVSVNGVLARNHKEVVDQIDAQASRGGTAEIVVAARELSNDVDKVMGQHHAVGVPLVPCEIIVDIM